MEHIPLDVEGLRLFLAGEEKIYDPESPDYAAVKRELYRLGAKEVYDPTEFADAYANIPSGAVAAITLKNLCEFKPYYDALILLPDWTYSETASAERDVASLIGVETYLAEDITNIDKGVFS